MALVVPNSGRLRFLGIQFGLYPQESFYLKLFANNYTPDVNTILGNLTEVSGFGYAQKTLAPGAFTLTQDTTTYIQTTAQQLFSFTGNAGNIYGYYLVGVTSGSLFVVERFDNPALMSNNGDELKVTPKIQFGAMA